MSKRAGKYSVLTSFLFLSLVGVSFAQVPQVNHVFIVLEENTNYADAIGNPAMPYLNSLANRYGVATNYFGNTHPSIGNYFMLTAGQIVTNNDSYSNTVNVDNIVRQLLAHGKTWKAYEEDLPSAGYIAPNTAGYARKHCPLSFFSDVVNSPTEIKNLVPFTQFPQDLANNQLPNYSFISPNLCNDAHDCPLSTADTWLRNNIDPLVTSPLFQNDGILVIVFDEAGSDNTNGGGKIAWVVVSPKAKTGFKSTTVYQHQSTLRMMAEALGLTSFPGAAATAPDMAEFFGNQGPAPRPPSAVLTVTPQLGNAPLTVVADSTGSSSPNGSIVSQTIDFGDGAVSTSTNSSHTYTATGTFAVKLTVTDNIGLTASAAPKTVVVNAPPNAPPSCSLSVSPSSGPAPPAVTATATCTAKNTIASTVIDWGDQSSPTNGSSGTHTYANAGSYTARVTATDSSNQTGTATQTVTATTPAPNAPPSCSLSVSPSSGPAPLPVTATATCTAKNAIRSTVIDWGDQSSPTTGSSGTHTYANAGSYMVRVTATDSSNQTGTATQTVTATTSTPNTPPSCSLSVLPSSGPAPLLVTATATCTAKNIITGTVINWGDGSGPTNGSSGTHTYTNAGSYTVRVTATDSSNQTGTATQTVTTTAGGATPFDFSLSATPPNQTGRPGTTVKYMVTVTSAAGYTGTIKLRVHGLPHGAKASFDPTSMQNAGSSTLTISLGKSIRAGTYHLTISGYSQHLTRRTSIVLTTVGQKPGSQTPDAEVVDD